MNFLRIVRRLLFFIGYTAAIVVEIYVRQTFFRADLRVSMRVRRRWARRLLRGVGVRLHIEGRPPDEPCLVVCNHRSYLDPILLLCDLDAFPVAKSELAGWPLLGRGAKLAGILYLQRENAHSRAAMLRLIAETIQSGFPVILFPEGTTSGLPTGVLPFKKGAFQLAAKNQLAVAPVALCFAEQKDFWVGKETFLRHAFRRFQQKTIRVKVCYGPLLRGEDTAELQDKSRQWIENQLTAHPPS